MSPTLLPTSDPSTHITIEGRESIECQAHVLTHTKSTGLWPTLPPDSATVDYGLASNTKRIESVFSQHIKGRGVGTGYDVTNYCRDVRLSRVVSHCAEYGANKEQQLEKTGLHASSACTSSQALPPSLICSSLTKERQWEPPSTMALLCTTVWSDQLLWKRM